MITGRTPHDSERLPTVTAGEQSWYRTLYNYLSVSRLLIAVPNTVSVLIGTIAARATVWEIAFAFVWSVLFYAYSCKVNDLADFRTDTLNSARRGPLATHAISLDRVAFWAAVELTILLSSALLSPISTNSKYAIVFLVLLTTYGNAYQKRSRYVHPVVMDFLFGLTMGAPILVACSAFHGVVSIPLILLAAAFGFQMIVLNSYSGNFKDLEHDISVRARTTSISMGVLRLDSRRWRLPPQYCALLLSNQCISVVLLGACLYTRVIAVEPIAVASLVLSVCGLVSLRQRLRKHVTGIPIELPRGGSDALTHYVSRPPHLFFNAAAFLFAAALIVDYYWLPLIVAIASVLPKVILQLVRFAHNGRSSTDANILH